MPSATVTMRAVASTRATSTKPTSALSASAQSLLYMGPANYSYAQFGLPRDLPKSTVTSAKIQLCGTAAWGGSRTLSGYRIVPAAYSKLNWDNRPALVVGSTAQTGSFLAGSTIWYEIDATVDFQAIAAGAPYSGHRLSNSEATVRAFYGQTHPTLYPRLILTYATSTPTPAQVSPSGTIGLAKPVFTWAAASDVTKVQTQADAVGGTFASPSWDSGDIITNLGHVDTNAAGWVGLANNASASLRFRQYGSLGWSAWSLPVTVTRVNYATLTTSLPAAGGTSNDPTPPHAWTFTGQAKFRLTIFDALGKTLYDSGEIAGADQAWTPVPTAIKIASTATLTSRLQVWDTRTDRKASPGDPGYVETSWSWTIAPYGSTAVATSLTAVKQATRPAPLLAWTRASGAPDEWIVERDGVLVDRFDGAEGQLTSTTWSREDWGFVPNRSTGYSVRAVVLNKMSAASNIATLNTVAKGVAIYEPVSGAWFNVAGDAASGLEKGETSLSYQGPYAQAPVKRILALGGIAGTVAGVLTTQGDRPVLDQLADVATIRAYPTRVCRLVFGYVNVPVVVSDLSAVISGDALPSVMLHRISFTVAQVDEFDTDPTGS